MTTTSAAPCPLHPWIAQPCNICTTTFSVAPAQGEPHDYDALIARVRERILPTHGGTAPAMSHWNLTSGDSLLHRDAADALERLARERDDIRTTLQDTNLDAERFANIADKWKWQVRDTCTRAERAEAERDALRECVRAADGLRAECDQVPPMVQQRNVLHAYDAARAKVTLP